MHFATDLDELIDTNPFHTCPRCDAEAMSVHTFHVHCGSCDYTEMLDYPGGYEDSEAIYLTVDELNELEDLDVRDAA